MSTSTSFSPAVTSDGSEHSLDANHQTFHLTFWPILFGALFIAIVWWLLTWKAKFWTSTGPISTPRPPTSDIIRVTRIRGAPVLGRPLAALRATSPNPPPPAYVNPPLYDNTPPPYGGRVRPS
ncbi:hypothetical protein BDM02DRAFT_3110797 [Thelephora ganbajun]|uniref:Uncharacterized protein n=1 Tax=Thelephora ganbajun TaxID=370292 RepID=A0ACB6ZQE1_THEGA|nr:hypothetical protein BDM02DRAFT_3110797 [Thelephora ganbajun]